MDSGVDSAVDKTENVDFSLVLHWFGSPTTPGELLEVERAGAMEGARGRHKSLPLETWIRIWNLLHWTGSTRPEAFASLGASADWEKIHHILLYSFKKP